MQNPEQEKFVTEILLLLYSIIQYQSQAAAMHLARMKF